MSESNHYVVFLSQKKYHCSNCMTTADIIIDYISTTTTPHITIIINITNYINLSTPIKLQCRVVSHH